MEPFIVGKREIGGASPCYIIAEMSSNHGGNFDRALETVRAASTAGADCIKLQTYTPDTLTMNCNNDHFQIKAGKWQGESLYSLYKKAYTPWEWHERLKLEAESLGMDFLSTPFDTTAVNFLEKLGVIFYKISSFEITDLPLLSYVASKRRPIILSTGMASVGEIRDAIAVIKSHGNNRICLLKCSSAYPAQLDEMNLKTIGDMQRSFHVPVGLSDHSLGSVTAVAAVALGAKVIEKHFCISRDLETPDSSFSMEYDEFRDMVTGIRDTEKALGRVSYEVADSEKPNLAFRKSIFAVKEIRKGEALDEVSIRVIRPGYGLEPKYYNTILGKTAVRDIPQGTPLSWDLLDCTFDRDTGRQSDGLVLETDRLTIREMSESDEDDIIRWRNQKDITDQLFSPRGPTLSEHREWYRQYLVSNTRLELVIIRNEDNIKLGTVGLSNIDPENGRAELGILLGEIDERGKGYGFEACFACIRYGFEQLNLNKIFLKVLQSNLIAQMLYKKLGFRQEGLLEKEFCKDGAYMDVIQMAVFKNDWSLYYG